MTVRAILVTENIVALATYIIIDGSLGAPGMRIPPRGPNSFIFMQFLALHNEQIGQLGMYDVVRKPCVVASSMINPMIIGAA